MRRFPAAFAMLLVLCGCAGSTVAPNLAPRVDVERSWVMPDAARYPLLYVSDWSTNDVFIYNYSTKVESGVLTGFKSPYGQCVDAAGNVWITELHGASVVEFGHGGRKPLRRLSTSGNAIGCAIDATSGNLAVTNFATPNGAGDIRVWAGAHGLPKTYHPTKLYFLWPPAYDDKGNLFVEGQVKNGAYGLAELPKGGTRLRTILLNGISIHYAGGVFWDGHYLGVTDQNAASGNQTVIYRISVTGTTAKLVGRTHLSDRCHGNYVDVVAPFAVRNAQGGTPTVVGGNLWCQHRFDFWKYPAGGEPAQVLAKAPEQPYGQSVSPAAK